MTERDDRTYRLPSPDMDVFGESTEPEPARDADAEPTSEPATPGHGSMSFQDRETTRARPPSLAEQRARAHAEEELAARNEALATKAAGRRRVMIGAGVTVGVVALVGAWYLLASPDNVTARCTVAGSGPDQDTVVQDQYCDEAYVNSHGGHISNGFIFLPIAGGGFQQYHYYYGGTGAIGQRATGGSFTAPSNANVKTGTGKTIQRGGFGITGKGGSGGS